MTSNYKRPMASTILGVLLLGSNAQAKAGDWQSVRNLKPGTHITVKAQHNVLCLFQSATDNELVCKPLRFLSLGSRNGTFDKQSVREIRREPNVTKHALIGAGIGGGAGAIAGATTGTPPRGGRATVLTLGGALVGSVAGVIVSIPLRGKLIYRQKAPATGSAGKFR